MVLVFHAPFTPERRIREPSDIACSEHVLATAYAAEGVDDDPVPDRKTGEKP